MTSYSRPTFLVAAALLALTPLAAALPAAAQVVTGPTGTKTVGQPVTFTWSGFPGGPSAPTEVALTITDGSTFAGTITIPLAQNLPNSGQHTMALPAFFCQGHPGLDRPIAQWTAYAFVSTGAGGRTGPGFKLRCPPGVFSGEVAVSAGSLGGAMATEVFQVGHLTVAKVVVNATGGAPPPYPKFTISVTCAPAGGATPMRSTLSLAAGQTVSLAQTFPVGAVCQASENRPAPVENARGCPNGRAKWTTTYSPPVTIAAAGAAAVLTVTNTLNCAP